MDNPRVITTRLINVIQLARCIGFLICCSITANTNAAGQSELLPDLPLPGPDESLVGALRHQVLQYEDTLAAVARINGLGLSAIENANPGVDVWLPEPGTKITLPTLMLLPQVPRQGIVINVSERRLYYFDEPAQLLRVYAIGIGKEGYGTPTMITKTVTKIENPSWTPPPSVRAEHAARGDTLPAIVPPGPDNPLGKYAIQLAVPGYFLHGTNQSMGVGQQVSHGCIRLYAPDIETLIRRVPNGTQVRVIRQPHKAAWHEGQLYLESHRDGAKTGGRSLTGAVAQVIAATAERPARINWKLVTDTALAAQGLPVRVSLD